MPLGGAKDEHFACFHSSCQLLLKLMEYSNFRWGLLSLASQWHLFREKFAKTVEAVCLKHSAGVLIWQIEEFWMENSITKLQTLWNSTVKRLWFHCEMQGHGNAISSLVYIILNPLNLSTIGLSQILWSFHKFFDAW